MSVPSREPMQSFARGRARRPILLTQSTYPDVVRDSLPAVWPSVDLGDIGSVG